MNNEGHIGGLTIQFEKTNYSLVEAKAEIYSYIGKPTPTEAKWWKAIEEMDGILELRMPMTRTDFPKRISVPGTQCGISFKAAAPSHKLFGVLPGSYLFCTQDKILKRMTWADANLERPSPYTYNALRAQRSGEWIYYAIILPIRDPLKRIVLERAFTALFS
jgi:hypothetical protein